MRRGYTLLEILVVIGILGIVTAAVARAYDAGVTMDLRMREEQTAQTQDRVLQDRLRTLLQGAYVTILANDTTSVFLGDFGRGSAAGQGGATTLTFTSLGEGVPRRVLASEDDFETLNQTFGPQGGLAEVSLSLTPVGQTNRNGLFLREQRPGDGDPSQGGFEEVLDPDIEEIEFEFWDGLAWQGTWDTREQGTRRIPAAVRITYRRADEEESRVFVVRLPHSDVTRERPLEANG